MSLAKRANATAQTKRRRVQIDEVNIANNVVTGIDRYGLTFQITYGPYFDGALVAIPKQGENWIIEQYRQEWRLKFKVEDLTQYPSLAPGDRLINAGTLWIDGNSDLTNGFLTLTDPISSQHAATKNYVDTQIIANGINNAHLSDVRQSLLEQSFGLLTENYNLLVATNTVALTSGNIYGGAVYLFAGDIITHIILQIGTAAAGTNPTLTKVGLWSSDTTPVCLAVSSDISSNLNTKQFLSSPLNSSYIISTSGVYYLALLMVGTFGTTQPAFARMSIPAGTNQIGTGKQFSPLLNTGATDMIVGNTGTYSSSVTNLWFGCN